MVDLKLYASEQRDFQQALTFVHELRYAVEVECEMDKCAMVHYKRRCGKISKEKQLVDMSILRHLDFGEPHAHFGVQQGHTQLNSTVKEPVCRKYKQPLWQIWPSELSNKNKIGASHMLAAPLLLYTFGAVKWTVDEL